MSDETLRTLITVLGTVATTSIGALFTYRGLRYAQAKKDAAEPGPDGPQNGSQPPPQPRPVSRSWLVGAAIAGALIGYLGIPPLARLIIPPKPTMSITSPKGGVVDARVMVRGKWANLPGDRRPWLLAYCYESDRFYPQSTAVTLLESGQWQCPVHVGRDGSADAGLRYDLMVGLADAQASRVLQANIAEGAKAGDFKGLETLPPTLKLYSLSTVTRRRVPPQKPRDLTIFCVSKASSQLRRDAVADYVSSNAVDGDPQTCWGEGVAGYGIGQSLTLGFRGRTVTVTAMSVLPGYAKKGAWSRWSANPRVRTARVEFSDGSIVRPLFRDREALQPVFLGKPRRTTFVRIVVESVYKPTSDRHRTEDTSISEVRIAGYAAP
jgi:hypothetical protein